MYYVFINIESFWETVNKLKDDGYRWMNYMDPHISIDDIPIVLNTDDSNIMLHGIVKYHKDFYFKNKEFLRLYNICLREEKLKTILNK